MRITTRLRSRLLPGLALLVVGRVYSQQLPPLSYYLASTNATGATLKSVLHDIIKGHAVIPYSSSGFDTHDALALLDQDPTNSANVTLIYSGYSVAASTWPGWNREHIWPESFGTDAGTQHSDLFNLRACNQGVNSSRGNKYYDVSAGSIGHHPSAPETSYDGDSWEPRDADKGFVARACFYMATRYDGTDGDINMTLSESPNAGAHVFAKFSTLLDWNRRFPPTDAERSRNGLISTNYQHNRNPFIDNPDFADMVFLGVDGFAAWQGAHFSNVQISNVPVSGSNADPDEDGLPNLLEYALGNNPNSPDASAIKSIAMQTVDETNYVYITHHKNHYASGILFGYEVSINLSSWALVSPELIAVTQIDPQKDLVIVRLPATDPSEFVRFRIHRLAEGPAIVADAATIVTEGCAPANGILDPSESVTMSFSLKNVGSADTSNLVATLLATGGVISPSGSQNYGSIAAGGTAASQSFSFVASGDCGESLTATLQIQDGTIDLGSVSYTFTLGQIETPLDEVFDVSATPDLPAGWTSVASGAQSNWVTSAIQSDTLPNAAFSPDRGGIGVNELAAPPFFVNSASAQLMFQQNYSMTASTNDASVGYDGGVLEIRVGENPFQDILEAGGSFVSGGYNTTLSGDYGNPLAGRQAWSGRSSGFLATAVILPTAAAGQNVQLRWRCGTGSSPTAPSGIGPSSFSGVLAGWDTSALSGYGPTPFGATTNAANITVGGLTRGSGVTTSGSAAGRAWGGNGWTDGSAADAITNNRFATYTVQASSGSSVSFSSISKFDYRRSSTGPPNGLLQYQVGLADSFHDIATVSYSSTSSSGASIGSIDLSSISALQNVPAVTVVTFRIVNWGGSNPSGTWYIFDKAIGPASDFEIQGTVTQGSVGAGWYIDSVFIEDAACCGGR